MWPFRCSLFCVVLSLRVLAVHGAGSKRRSFIGRRMQSNATGGSKAKEGSDGFVETLASTVEDGTVQLNIGDSTGACTCDNCRGERLLDDNPPDGYKGFQCGPTSSVQGMDSTCAQQGDSANWVVQTAQIVTYNRFCHYTCRPMVPEKLTDQVSCTAMSLGDVKKAQTASGNGRTFVWRSNPMVDTLTMAEVGAADSLAANVPSTDAGDAVDPAAVMRETFLGSTRRRTPPPLPTLPPPQECCCNCNCGPTTTLAPDAAAATVGAFAVR